VEVKELVDIAEKRTWNDSKRRKEELKRGKFDEKETQILMNAICQHVRNNNLGIQGLIDLCSKSKEDLTEDLKGAWCRIAENLPNRSV